MTASDSIEVPVRRRLRCEVNDRILETYTIIGADVLDGYDDCEIFCECARPCTLRIVVPATVVAENRRPGRFLVSPGHVVEGERVAGESGAYWVIETG